MGCGIAHVFALSGFRVLLNDISQDRIEAGIATITGNMARQIASGKLAEADSEAALARIHPATNLGAMAEVDLAIEAASENEAIKIEILREVSSVLAPEAIIASNTSSISITRLAAATDRPEQFIGMHFMNPVPVMKLVEIIRGIATSQETFEITKSIVETLSNLSSLPAQWYTATTQGPRGCDAAVLSDALTQVGVDANAIVTCDSVKQAYANAREDYKDGELILVFGSFVTVADVLE